MWSNKRKNAPWFHFNCTVKLPFVKPLHGGHIQLSRPESKDELLVGLGILVITVFFIGGVVGWLLHLAIM